MITAAITTLGRWGAELVEGLGRIAIFFVEACVSMVTPHIQLRKTFQQVYFIGLKSVLVICLTGAFTGMVLGLQGYYVLVKYGSVGSIGSAVALSLIREMGPVLTAVMVVARAGSAMAAEIGIMRISEQIDALDTMGINPIRFLISPRLAGAILSFPLLTAIFDVVGIFGGYLTGSVLLGGVTSGIYFSKVESAVQMQDVTGGFIKSLVFAAVVATICCFQGFYTHLRKEHGAKGVSLSTTTAVVSSCVLVLVTDYVLTSFLL